MTKDLFLLLRGNLNHDQNKDWNTDLTPEHNNIVNTSGQMIFFTVGGKRVVSSALRDIPHPPQNKTKRLRRGPETEP